MALAFVVSANMLCQFNRFASVIIQVAMFLSHSEGVLPIQQAILNATQKLSVCITAHVGGIFARLNCLSFLGARHAYPDPLMYRRLKCITKNGTKGTSKNFTMVHSILFASLVTLLKRPRKLDGISDPPPSKMFHMCGVERRLKHTRERVPDGVLELMVMQSLCVGFLWFGAAKTAGSL